MILNNLFDYVNQEDATGFKFWIPNSDPAVPFPYEIDSNEVIIDKDGVPAMFALWMLDSLDWDLWNEVSDGASVEVNLQEVQTK